MHIRGETLNVAVLRAPITACLSCGVTDTSVTERGGAYMSSGREEHVLYGSRELGVF